MYIGYINVVLTLFCLCIYTLIIYVCFNFIFQSVYRCLSLYTFKEWKLTKQNNYFNNKAVMNFV